MSCARTDRLFLKFVQEHLHKAPCRLFFEDIEAPLVNAFLDHLEKQRGLSVRSWQMYPLGLMLIGMFDLRGSFYRFINGLDFGVLGYVIVGMFLLAWGLSVAMWKFGRIEERYTLVVPHVHTHEHVGGVKHSHPHMHKER